MEYDYKKDGLGSKGVRLTKDRECDTCTSLHDCLTGRMIYPYGWRVGVYDSCGYISSIGRLVEGEWVYASTEEEALDLYIRIHGSNTEYYNVDCCLRFIITMSTVYGCVPIGIYAKEHAALGRRIFLKFKL